MNATISELCTSLEAISQVIRASSSANSNFLDAFGWNSAAITRDNLADVPLNIANRLRKADIETVDDGLSIELQSIPSRITKFQTGTLPYLYNGNSGGAIPAFLGLMYWIEITIQPLFEWEKALEAKTLPKRLTNQLRFLQTSISTITTSAGDLEAKVKKISDAHEAAESLPVDLEALNDARTEVANVTEIANNYLKEIETLKGTIISQAAKFTKFEEEAERIIVKCNEVYSLATSTGLAGAFDYRAKRLNLSMILWIVGLVAALAFGGWLGAIHFESIAKELTKATVNWNSVWLQIALSLVGLLPTIWFAWLSTKQISQRFRLAEDYAYKASISNAYEGYKREAANLDSDFQARLFGSALTRLEEPPLRLVEQENHGSPIHELMNSAAFLKAMDIVPGLAEQVARLYNPPKGKRKLSKQLEGKSDSSEDSKDGEEK